MGVDQLAPFRPSLDELAQLHGTDKSKFHHRFADLYDAQLADRRDLPVSVLEIGVLEGAGLRMWRDYFPEGRVIGVDINESAGEYVEERIDIRIGDQADPKLLRRLGQGDGPFDLIVDDGGHYAEQQITSLEVLWPYLKPGGLYAVEDIHTSYIPGWQRGGRTTVGFLQNLVDDLHELMHERPSLIGGVESISFYFELCLIRRSKHADPGPAPPW
jgi:hypothetical protein